MGNEHLGHVGRNTTVQNANMQNNLWEAVTELFRVNMGQKPCNTKCSLFRDPPTVVATAHTQVLGFLCTASNTFCSMESVQAIHGLPSICLLSLRTHLHRK
ncbi:hypothetical protein CDAR_490831 [Caerostris darwini]|uniref:Uncharacterized protein n=1 Tax=Caerostris darwini TaxID=1538125 RepID=A0AAV4NM39_9ARAC|nr:hypothetical protein CDAR_490831 [Caerostris darwini]